MELRDAPGLCLKCTAVKCADGQFEEVAKVRQNVVELYRIAKLLKNGPMAKAALSGLIANTTTVAKLANLVSSRATISLGMLVAVRSQGNAKIEGIVESIDAKAGACSVRVHERSEATKRKRFVTKPQEAAEEIVADMTPTDLVLEDVPLDDVTEVGSVRCSEYEAREARLHAEMHFPGKLVVKELLAYHRVRKSTDHELAMAQHYEDEELFPLRYSSGKGAIYFRALSVRMSFKLACAACTARGCEKPRWEDYLNVLMSTDCKRQVPMNCVCSYCRILGLESFDEFVECISYINLPDAFSEEYLKRTKLLRRYLCVDYAGRLKEESASCVTEAASNHTAATTVL